MPSKIPSRLSCAQLSLALTLALLSGCGENHPTGSVSGSVTYEGKPFSGTITFIPSGDSTERKDTSVPVREGRYEIPTISTGTKKVMAAKDEAAKPASQPAPGPGMMENKPNPMQFLYPKPKTVEVQPGSQTMDFTLTSKP